MKRPLEFNIWRLLFLVLGTVLVCAALAAFYAYLNRQDLIHLWMPQPPDPPPRKAPPPVETRVPEVAPSKPPPPRTIDWSGLKVLPYRGEHQGDFLCKKTTSKLDQDLLDAVKDLKDASGLFPSAQDRLRVSPLDFGACSFTGPYALRPPTEGPYVVEVAVEPMILRWYAPRQVLASALAEGILTREVAGYASGPAWLRHGLALELSGFGNTYIRRLLLTSEAHPDHRIRPLGEATEDPWLNGWLAIRYFKSQRGDEGLKFLIGSLRMEGDWRRALAAQDFPENTFEEGFRAWAVSYLRDRCVNRETLAEMEEMLRREEESDVRPLIEDFVKNRPLDLYSGDARYYLGYTLYRLGEYDEAIYVFTDLLQNQPTHTSRQGKAHFFLGRCYQIKDYGPLAEQEYRFARLAPENAFLRKLANKRFEELQP